MAKNQKPTSQQESLAEQCRLHPTWPLSKLLRAAGYSESTVKHYARAAFESDGVQQALAASTSTEALNQVGATDELVARRFKEGLDYKKVQRIKLGSPQLGTDRVEEFIDVDNMGRLRAAELVARVKGWIKSDAQTVNVLTVLMPVVLKYIPQEKQAEFAAEVEVLSGDS